VSRGVSDLRLVDDLPHSGPAPGGLLRSLSMHMFKLGSASPVDHPGTPKSTSRALSSAMARATVVEVGRRGAEIRSGGGSGTGRRGEV
jgi:hypothetical protein